MEFLQESVSEGPLQLPSVESLVNLNQMDTLDSAVKQPSSLLDLAAQATAKYCSASDLDKRKEPLDEALMLKVVRLSFPQDIRVFQSLAEMTGKQANWNLALNLEQNDAVKEMHQIGFMATAHLTKFHTQSDRTGYREIIELPAYQWLKMHGEVRVSLLVEKQKIIRTKCSECPDVWCEHVLAAIIHRIKRPEKVTIHAPMTESLSSLSRDQLQKLLQYAVNEDPAGIMGKIFNNYQMEIITRSACPTLSRWWHDLSHIHALLVLRTEDKEARSVLLSTALHINATEVMREHILQTSDWSELPSLTQLFPHETEKLKAEEGNVMLIESVLANQLQPIPRDVCRLLEATDNCENTSYNEDVIIMLARLESFYHFDQDYQKMTRLGFHVLHKLSIQAKKYSSLRQFVGSSSDKSDSGAPSSLIKLFCPGPPASSTKQEPESLLSSSSSSVQPMDTDSADVERVIGRKTALESSEEEKPIKRFKSMPLMEEDQQHLNGFVWSSTRLAYAMLYTLRIIIESQKVSASDSIDRKVLVRFCLQALELSRYRMQAVISPSNQNISAGEPSSNQSESPIHIISSQSERPKISQAEYDWCQKSETAVCDYLETASVDESHSAVSMYIDSLCITGTSFYPRMSPRNESLKIGGAYPLSLLGALCNLLVKDDALKESKSKEFKKFLSEIILNSTSSHAYNSLLREDLLQTLINDANPRAQRYFSVHDFTSIIDAFFNDLNRQKFQDIISVFLTLLVRDSSEDIELLSKIHNHLEYIRSFALLKLISRVLQRTQFWSFSNNIRVMRTILKPSIRNYQVFLGVCSYYLHPFGPGAALRALMAVEDFETRSGPIEKDLLVFLFRKLDISALTELFSNVWQYVFSCKELQDLIVYLGDKDKNKDNFSLEGAGPTPELLSLIDEFYNPKYLHEEGSCTLLERYFTPGSDQYKRISEKIIGSTNNYHPGALFHLAKLNSSTHSNINSSSEGAGSTVVPMNQETFDIVDKAFQRLGSTAATSSILEAVEWVFNSCVMDEAGEQREDITSLQFYGKLIQGVCKHAKYQPQVILKVLEKIEAITGGIDSSYLAQHGSIKDLRSALLVAYREYFDDKFTNCSHREYTEPVNEMLAARAECKKFVQDGGVEFDKEVVLGVVAMHSGKKKLVAMLNKEFPSNDETKDN